MKKLPHTVFILTIFLFASTLSQACTTFCLKKGNHLLVGKNLDFYTGSGFVSVNKRNLRKTSFFLPPQRPISWTARYGSVTFNQVGKEFPYGGINEKGLVVETMWLAGSEYSDADHRAGLFEMQWVQYQLDNAASVGEVLAADTLVRIAMPSAPVHFFVVDATGNIAVIEFLDGSMVSHSGSSLPVCALANDTYKKSKDFFHAISDPEQYCSNSSTRSLDRFAKAAMMVSNFNDQPATAYGFDILDAVRQGSFTKWSIVYDIRNMTISYKTDVNASIRMLKLSEFDFSCQSPATILPVNEDFTDQESAFSLYSYMLNYSVIDSVFDVLADKPEFQHITPTKQEREWLARYPDSVTCVASGSR